MNQKRKREGKRIQSEIQATRNHITKVTASIARLTLVESTDPTYTASHISKLNVIMTKLNVDLEVLRDRDTSLRHGLLDDELRAAAKAVEDEIKAKNMDKQKKKEKEADEDEANKVASQAYWDATVKSERSSRYAAKNMNREYKFYTDKLLNSMPGYMTENLRRLPENKGYIWKGIYNYGERPPQPGRPIEMEEQLRGKGLFHVWTKQHDGNVLYRKSEKVGKGRDMKKKLILEEIQRPIVWGTTSCAFWK